MRKDSLIRNWVVLAVRCEKLISRLRIVQKDVMDRGAPGRCEMIGDWER